MRWMDKIVENTNPEKIKESENKVDYSWSFCDSLEAHKVFKALSTLEPQIKVSREFTTSYVLINLKSELNYKEGFMLLWNSFIFEVLNK